MRLAESFMVGGRIMVPGGRTLDEQMILSILQRFPHAHFRIGDPMLDAMAEFDDDKHDREVASAATLMIAESLGKVHDRLAGQTDFRSINFDAARSTCEQVAAHLRDNPVSAAILANGMNSGSYLAQHAGNVFYLAMVLGLAVRDYVARERRRMTSARHLSGSVALDLIPLGLGTMFMDIAMVPLQNLVDREDVLTPDELALIRSHPEAGVDMLPDTLPAGVRTIVRTHHENYDGTGYPDALAGSKLHVFSRIARICDAFDAATTPHGGKPGKSPARAIWELTQGPTRSHFDPVLAKVFASMIQPFPIGAKLKLSDGTSAVVCRYNKKDPFKPMVIVAFDEQDFPLQRASLKPPFCLADRPELRVVAFGSEDLGFLGDSPAQAASLAA
jgi:HD-GYP domain-containing protein (c-di-GMP phosphodiesterase class II)